jgi:hypothetical protein
MHSTKKGSAGDGRGIAYPKTGRKTTKYRKKRFAFLDAKKTAK